MNNIFTFLPNDIIMNIIRQADGGLHKHKHKMNHAFLQITGRDPISYFTDGEGNDDCPYFIWEAGGSGRVGTIADSDSDSDSDDE